MTDYEAELKRIDSDIAAMQAKASTGVLSADDAGLVRLLYRRFQGLALTGEMSALRALDAEINDGIAASSTATDLWLLKAKIAHKRHRFAEAQAALLADAALATSSPARLLQADIEFQQGRYAVARETLEAVIAEDLTWDALARLAFFTATMGDVTHADKLYEAAEDELTAKQMQTFAWMEAQRGWMHFQRGDHDRAALHYRRADKAYSGYWLITERLAELAGARGRFSEAIATYQSLYSALMKPEWAHALIELHSLSGAHEEAERWRQRGYDDCLSTVADGDVYALHYLAELCCEWAGHGEEAVEWARKDEAMRSHYATQGDLAWALYRAGRCEEALPLVDRALASGAVSARLFTQAGCVYSAAGRRELGAKYLKLALEVNPRPAKANIPALMRMRRVPRG